MEMRVQDTKSFRTQYRRFDKHLTKKQFDTQFQYLSIKYQNDPAALLELDELCEEAFIAPELFEKEYQSILERVGEVFFINNMNTRSLDLFKKLIGLKSFMKRVLRDFFITQSAEKKSIHDLYKFIIQNQFRVNKTQYKFYLKAISSIFFFNYNPENVKAIDLRKIFTDESEVEIPLQRILDRIHENLSYLEKDEPIFGLVEKEQARNPFAQNKFADFDLKNQENDFNDNDDLNPSEEKILDDDFLREVNKKDDEIDDEIKPPEDEEEEEEKKENKNEQKKENKNELFRLDSQSDEEVKRKDEEEPNFDNSLTLDIDDIKDASNFLDEKKKVSNENNKIKENPQKIENLKEPSQIIETNTLKEIKKKIGDEQPGIINESNVVSKSEIAIADYMADFIIPKGKMISRSIKNIEIVRGKFTLFCDNCKMPKLENIIKRSKIKGIRECITCCNLCGTNKAENDGKEKNIDELQSVDFKKNSIVEDTKEIPPKGEAQTLEQFMSNVGNKPLSNLPRYELKAFFRITIIPKRKPTEPMSFCRIYTENSFFWVSNDSTNSKKLKKKPIPIPRDPRTGRPMIKPKVQVDDKDFGKLFHDIVFQFTCDCDSKYEHKGLPLGNENSFQKQCDKCWSSMIFQINEIEVKMLEPTEYDVGSKTFLRERFFV